jgi:hypothetical protein
MLASANHPPSAPESDFTTRCGHPRLQLLPVVGEQDAARSGRPYRLFAAPFTGTSYAQSVDLLVILTADVSRSVDDGEFELERKGYAAAVVDPRVLGAIHKGPNKTIAVSFIEWAGPDEQKVVVDWTRLADEEDAGGLAAAILAPPRSFAGRTSISAAIDFAVARFAAAKWQAPRRVIDIAGDGNSNSGRAVTAARDDAVTNGVTINGLAIINNRPDMAYSSHTHPPGGLPNYYKENVIGGPGAFLVVVTDFHSFADAMAKKLVREIEISQQPTANRLAAATRSPSVWADTAPQDESSP